MDDPFQIQVRAASVAAWWTLLIAAVFLTIQWIAYLSVLTAQPDWVLWLWGPGATWESVRTVWLDALLVVKLTLWPIVLAALWLTLWARQLRKRTPSA